MNEKGQAEEISRGIVMIATGKPYVSAAVPAAKSAKALMPDIAIDLFCDDDYGLDFSVFDKTFTIEDPHRRSKVDCLSLSRFQRTLYVDTDIRFVADVCDLFDLLDRFDVGLAHAHTRNRPETNSVWRLALPHAFPQFNGGVIVYGDNDRVKQFLHDWKQSYADAGFSKDQVTLRELLWRSDLRICTLPPEYNIRYRKYLWVWRKTEAQAKILHYASFHSRTPSLLRRKTFAQLMSGG